MSNTIDKAISLAMKEQYSRLSINYIRKGLNISIGQTIKVDRQKYRVLELFDFHILTENTKFGWRECFTYGELWVYKRGKEAGD